jgi:hypothetical protein
MDQEVDDASGEAWAHPGRLGRLVGASRRAWWWSARLRGAWGVRRRLQRCVLQIVARCSWRAGEKGELEAIVTHRKGTYLTKIR